MKKGPGKPTPVAPPAYRPMPVPKVLQRKTAVAGPNVNKPAPIPHVLQRKAITPPAPMKSSPLVQRKQPARPGISRPGILQPKVIRRAAEAWLTEKQSFRLGPVRLSPARLSAQDSGDKRWAQPAVQSFSAKYLAKSEADTPEASR